MPAPSGSRRTGWWRVVVALIAFLVWAHPSFVGLPYAALVLLAPLGTARAAWMPLLAGFIGSFCTGLLVVTATGGGRLGAVTSAFIVLVTATFIAVVLLRPRSLTRMAVRAVWMGMAVTTLLIQIMWGTTAWGALSWEVTRRASSTIRVVATIFPQWFGAYEPTVRLVSLTWPAVLGLQALAGLAIAWHLYRRSARVTPDEMRAGPEALVPGTTPTTT